MVLIARGSFHPSCVSQDLMAVWFRASGFWNANSARYIESIRRGSCGSNSMVCRCHRNRSRRWAQLKLAKEWLASLSQ